MDEYLYQNVVVVLLSYLSAFALVLLIELLSLASVLGALVLGTALAFGILATLD